MRVSGIICSVIVCVFLWPLCLIDYLVRDFNCEPSSSLLKFQFGLFMVVWYGFVGYCVWSLRSLL
jgi:hypothetical protein